MATTEQNEKHVHIRLEATCGYIVQLYTPHLEAMQAILNSYTQILTNAVTQAGGYQPGIVRHIITHRDYEQIAETLPERWGAEFVRQLDEALEDSLEEGIEQSTVVRALESYVTDLNAEVKDEYGFDADAHAEEMNL